MKTKFDYQSTQLNLPKMIADKIRALAKSIPENELHKDPTDNYKAAQTGRETDPHVTVLYGLDKKVGKDDIQEVVEKSPPVEIKLGKVSLFDTNEDYDVVKVEVESPGLRALNKRLKESFETPGATFKDYKPHATIAYVKKGEGEKYEGNTKLKGQKAKLNSVGFSTTEGKMIELPLALGGALQ